MAMHKKDECHNAIACRILSRIFELGSEPSCEQAAACLIRDTKHILEQFLEEETLPFMNRSFEFRSAKYFKALHQTFPCLHEADPIEVHFIPRIYKAMIRQLERAIQQNPDYTQLYYALSEVYLKINDLQKTGKVLQKVLQDKQYGIFFRYKHIRTILQTPKRYHARQLIETVINEEKSAAFHHEAKLLSNMHTMNGLIHIIMRPYQKAYTQFQQAISFEIHDKPNEYAFRSYIEATMLTFRPVPIQQYIKRYIQYFSQQRILGILAFFARLKQDEQDYQQILAKIRCLAVKYGQHSIISRSNYRWLGIIESWQHNTEDSYLYFTKGMDSSTNSILSYLSFAYECFRLRRFSQCLKYLNITFSFRPLQLENQAYIALTLIEMGKVEQAQQAIRQIQQFYNISPCILPLARCYSRLNKAQKVLNLCNDSKANSKYIKFAERMELKILKLINLRRLDRFQQGKKLYQEICSQMDDYEFMDMFVGALNTCFRQFQLTINYGEFYGEAKIRVVRLLQARKRIYQANKDGLTERSIKNLQEIMASTTERDIESSIDII